MQLDLRQLENPPPGGQQKNVTGGQVFGRYRCVVIFFLVLLTGCAIKFPVANRPVNTQEKGFDVYDEMRKGARRKGADHLSLILTFSGGGTRAAAFSYGVLKELKATMIDEQTSLLSQVDVISSVSGGSFTAAYYGLYGDDIFETYEKRFLKQSVQSQLVDMFLNPLNWVNLSNRSDLVARYYAEDIFENKTFNDLRPDGPWIVINATDLSVGTAFSFTRTNFHRICSDLGDYPISKAVTASSAVPVVFSPLTLKNYGGCSGVPEVRRDPAGKMRYNDEQSLLLRKYQDKKRYPYLHLVDGGIADNLGVRALIQIATEFDNDFARAMDAHGLRTDKVAVIVVNAADGVPPRIGRNKEAPDAATTMGAVSTIQLKRYNSDTLDMLSDLADHWKASPDGEAGGGEFYLIDLNFNQLPVEQAEYFSTVETSLELPSETVDALIEAGGRLLRSSTEFRTLLNDLKTVGASRGY